MQTIENLAFGYSGIREITIPNSVTTIASQAFESAPITSIKIPSSVLFIGKHAFRGSSLTTIEIDDVADHLRFESELIFQCPISRFILRIKDVSRASVIVEGLCSGSYLKLQNISIIVPPELFNDYSQNTVFASFKEIVASDI